MKTAPHHPFTATLAGAPNGRAGAFHTIRTMRALVNRARVDPMMIQAATSIIYLAPQRDQLAEVNALFEFVRDDIRYVRDVVGIETLADPRITLRRMVGDCDDQSTLLATLAEAVGYPTRFVMAGYRSPSVFDHVYVQVLAGGQWIDADPTEDGPLGYAPPGAVVTWIESR